MELNSKWGEVKIFTDNIEETAFSQIIEMANSPLGQNANIRIMPDVHAGAGCVIGTTMQITNKVCPNLVGVDIGCGMSVFQLEEKEIDLVKLDKIIREYIPSGFAIRKTPHFISELIELSQLYCKDHVKLDRARLSIGTLGGGNHFIEIAKDEEGNLYLVIHSGSRHLGLEIAKYYQNLAYAVLNRKRLNTLSIVEYCTKNNLEHEIQSRIAAFKEENGTKISKDLSFLTDEEGYISQYLHDMDIAQNYAEFNRRAMAIEIMTQADYISVDNFTTVHNYIDTDTKILRKGAVSANEGERLLIPINMRDGSLICTGKGNPDWNYSAPHGAGRVMSRSAAKLSFSIDEFEKEMEGIYSSSVGKSTLDECPMAYKGIESIINNIQDTVSIDKHIKPIYNFKAS